MEIMKLLKTRKFNAAVITAAEEKRARKNAKRLQDKRRCVNNNCTLAN